MEGTNDPDEVSEQKVIESYYEMFDTEGWNNFIEGWESTLKALEYTNTSEGVSNEQLNVNIGKASVVRGIINFKNILEQQIEGTKQK